jgi:hypothetical protein
MPSRCRPPRLPLFSVGPVFAAGTDGNVFTVLEVPINAAVSQWFGADEKRFYQ